MKAKDVKRLIADLPDYKPFIFDGEGGDGGDGGDGGADGSGDDGGGDDNGGDGGEKRYTQEEVNKIIAERLKRERAKSKASEDEAAKLARMSESQKQAKALKDLQDRLDAMEAKEARAKMAATARRMLQDDGVHVDDTIIDALVRDSAEDTDAAVKAFAKSYKAALKNEAKQTFRKSEPKAGGADTVTKADILKIADRAERQKAIKRHPELFR